MQGQPPGYGGPPGGGGYGGPPGGGGYGGPPGGGGYGGPPGQPPGGGGYGAPPAGGYGGPPAPGGPGYPQPMAGYPMPGAPGGGDQVGTKSKFMTIMLAWGPPIFGICGVHRFYTGHIGIGIAQLLTFGGCGIWQLVDIIMIFTGKYRDSEGKLLIQGDHPVRKMM